MTQPSVAIKRASGRECYGQATSGWHADDFRSGRETRATRRAAAQRVRPNGLHSEHVRERVLEYARVADTVPAIRACRAIRPSWLRFGARRRTIVCGCMRLRAAEYGADAARGRSRQRTAGGRRCEFW